MDENVQKTFESFMAERFGPDWRSVPEDEAKRALRDETDALAGDLARLEQQITLHTEVAEFGKALSAKIEQAVADRGVTKAGPEVWGQVLDAFVKERFGDWNDHALLICQELGFEIGRGTGSENDVS